MSGEHGVAYAGVDVGGTKIAAGYLDEAGRPVSVGTEPTTPGGGTANLAAIERLLAHPALRGAETVGLSVATTLNADATLRDPRGWFGWTGIDPGERLSTAGRSVVTVADAEAGAMGELVRGAGAGSRHLLYVTVGTGVAHCFVHQGEPLAGAHRSAYFSGYTSPARCPWPPLCDESTVEDISSGSAIARAWSGDPRHDAREVFRAAGNGDERATTVIDHAAWHLGALVADLIMIYDPDIVVIGGGLGTGADAYRESAVQTARRRIVPEHARDVPIVPAALDGMSCWVGALELARGGATPSAPGGRDVLA
ncbi:ROK family protein [Actinoallomurus soli]|uniref:ROK family protein n=1 Tax=Actinoallomurus soli TaxID=2952535 RepID=UPI0020930817|nr:ROK family protein [Actinoallomurus soli]MCO5969412.1 ROK family protein [Actinoallomurus soli]